MVQGQSRAARLFLTVFCALFFAISFSYIIRAGRLTLVPIYDDVSYLNDAISRLTYLDAGGILGFLRSFTFMPAHSPVLAVIGTLGFLFGLARGFLIMVVAYLFFNWLVQNEQGQPEWIRDARSKVVLQSAGDWLISVLPEDPESLIRDIRNSRDTEPTEPPPEPFNPGPAAPTAP